MTTNQTATKQQKTTKGAARATEKPQRFRAAALREALSYTRQREFAEHVAGAKRPETRGRRIEKSIRLLAAGHKEPR